jgi:hypothetical protein
LIQLSIKLAPSEENLLKVVPEFPPGLETLILAGFWRGHILPCLPRGLKTLNLGSYTHLGRWDGLPEGLTSLRALPPVLDAHFISSLPISVQYLDSMNAHLQNPDDLAALPPNLTYWNASFRSPLTSTDCETAMVHLPPRMTVIPHAIIFYLPETAWHALPRSLQSMVIMFGQHRRATPEHWSSLPSTITALHSPSYIPLDDSHQFKRSLKDWTIGSIKHSEFSALASAVSKLHNLRKLDICSGEIAAPHQIFTLFPPSMHTLTAPPLRTEIHLVEWHLPWALNLTSLSLCPRGNITNPSFYALLPRSLATLRLIASEQAKETDFIPPPLPGQLPSLLTDLALGLIPDLMNSILDALPSRLRQIKLRGPRSRLTKEALLNLPSPIAYLDIDSPLISIDEQNALMSKYPWIRLLFRPVVTPLAPSII